MRPVLFSFGPFTLYSYGFMLALAFLAGLITAVRNAKRAGISTDAVLDIVIYVIISAIVGARAFYVVQFWQDFTGKPLEIFAIHHGGLVFYGGLLFAIAALVWRARVHRMNLFLALDIASVSAALGYSIGRIGCFLNGCCFGLETNCPLGVKFPNLLGVRHPTQLYSSFLVFLIFLILLRLFSKKGFSGQVFFVGAGLYSVYRFFIEFLREGPRYAFGLTASQFVSVFLFFAVLFYLTTRPKTL